MVRRSITFHTRQPIEDEGENKHRYQRLEHRPQSAQERLAVANLNVAPYQENEQLSIEICLFEINGLPAFTRPDSKLERGGHLAPKWSNPKRGGAGEGARAICFQPSGSHSRVIEGQQNHLLPERFAQMMPLVQITRKILPLYMWYGTCLCIER